MKKHIIRALNKPRIVTFSSLIIALMIGGALYTQVGRAPIVNLPATQGLTNTTDETLGNSVDLSFIKAGRVSNVFFTNGSQVKKGDIIATLDSSDVLGTLNQAKGALELAKAQYASLDIQYANAKKQQDLLVLNARRVLLSSNITAIAKDRYNTNELNDSKQIPQITGTYTCDKEGIYDLTPYTSGVQSGYSFNFTGLENGTGNVTYHTPQPLGSCGLMIQFPEGYYASSEKWIIEIPNKRSSTYVTNKNAYDLAIANRDQVLSQYEANLGKNGSSDANIARAAVSSAEGAYEAAQAAYNNTTIVAPIDGTITFIDSHLKVGQTINANKTLITISKQ